MASELLPCPFCGATPRWQAEAVVCLRCHVSIPAFLHEGRKLATIRAWNRREATYGRDTSQQRASSAALTLLHNQADEKK